MNALAAVVLSVLATQQKRTSPIATNTSNGHPPLWKHPLIALSWHDLVYTESRALTEKEYTWPSFCAFGGLTIVMIDLFLLGLACKESSRYMIGRYPWQNDFLVPVGIDTNASQTLTQLRVAPTSPQDTLAAFKGL